MTSTNTTTGQCPSHLRWHGDAFSDGQIIDTITPKNSRTIENDATKKAEPVRDPGLHPGSWRAVRAYSGKRAARDNKTLTSRVVCGTGRLPSGPVR